MWAAHDDIWPEGFVSAAAHCLASDPSAVMVNSRTQLIDGSGSRLPDWPSRPQLVDLSNKPYASRIEELAKRVGWCIYGLVRREAIARTSVFSDNSPTQDVLLTYELAAAGSFRVLPDIDPFMYRMLPKTPGQVASNLGIGELDNKCTMTNLFCQCLRAIETSGQEPIEIQRAKKLFIGVCANHSEWSDNIRKENGWSNSLWGRLRRRTRLRRLCGNNSE